MTTPAERRPGLLIVDHGTRDPSVNARLGDFAGRVAARMPEWSVVHAHMELGEPDLMQAVEGLVALGVTEIQIHPHFLTAGYHVTESIPALIETARQAYPQIAFQLGDPLGEEDQLVDLVVSRMKASAS